MVIWPNKKLIIAIHDRQLAEHGGTSGLRDETLLESALARPQQLHAYGEPSPDLADLAASLAYGLAKNHPFLDGNKRTAFVACRVFLRLNEADYIATAEEKFLTFLQLSEGALSEDELACWLRERIRLPDHGKVQEEKASYG